MLEWCPFWHRPVSPCFRGGGGESHGGEGNAWKLSIFTFPYSDVIMSAMTSQITGASIVYSIICSGVDQRKKLRGTGLCQGNSPVTEENGSIWWRHHVHFPFQPVRRPPSPRPGLHGRWCRERDGLRQGLWNPPGGPACWRGCRCGQVNCELTHQNWSLDSIDDILQTLLIFKCFLLKETSVYFDLNLIEVCYEGINLIGFQLALSQTSFTILPPGSSA